MAHTPGSTNLMLHTLTTVNAKQSDRAKNIHPSLDSSSGQSAAQAKQPKLVQARTELRSAKHKVHGGDFGVKNNMAATAFKKYPRDRASNLFDDELEEWAVEDKDEEAVV